MKHPVVILVHGIHTSKREAREWMRKMGLYLSRAIPGLEVLQFKYGWISGISVRLPIWGWFSRRRKTRKFQRFVARAVKERGPETHPDVVAHSFGTWLAHHSMTKGGPKTFFRRLVYMGGIVSSREDFRAEEGHYEKVLNLYSRNDMVVRYSLFGHCGHRGFINASTLRVQSVDVTPAEHGDYIKPGRMWGEAGEFLTAA
jgi:hypothetical protein